MAKGEKQLGYIMNEQMIRFTVRLHVPCKRNRGVKDDSEVFDLSD